MANKARRPVPEAAFATQVEEALEMFGWRWYHVHDSRRDKAGFPDYVAVRGNRVVFAEIKGVDARGDKGRLRDAQSEWLEALGMGGPPGWGQARVAGCVVPHVEAYAWWPDDLDDLVRILR